MNNYHNSDSTYSFKGKDGRMMIEYSKITHFESREKRILLCTDNEEYYFYDTIDNLANVLPQEFVRCHRSFIVNVERIKKIRISDNCIFLDNGFIIPLSRSYKNKFKGRFTY
jgi:DNA-binding LytR/AlgR family response regulator